MIRTRRIWLGLTVAATASMGHAVAAQAREAAAPAFHAPTAGGESGESGGAGEGRGDFSEALARVLAGEGGEGGLGLTYQPGQISFPALTSAQITQALTGNTLRRDNFFAMHFQPGGRYTGWASSWKKVEGKRCEGTPGREYMLEHGECYRRTDMQVPDGAWSVKDGMLCVKPALKPATGDRECASVFLVLDRVALFDGKGAMLGKGNDLVEGRQLASTRE